MAKRRSIRLGNKNYNIRISNKTYHIDIQGTVVPPNPDGQGAPDYYFNHLNVVDFSTLPVGAFTHDQFLTISNDATYKNGLGYYNNYGDYYNRVFIADGTQVGDPTRFLRVWLEPGKHSTSVGCDMEFEWFPSPNSQYVRYNDKDNANWTAKQKYFEVYQNFKIRFYSDSPTGFNYEDGHMGGGIIGGYANVGELVGLDPNEGFWIDFNFGGIEWPAGGSPNEGTLANYSTEMRDRIQAKTAAGKKSGIWHMGIYDYKRGGPYARQVSVTDSNGYFMLIDDNRWYDVTLRSVMNTVGQENGILELYIDGTMIYQDTTVKYRVDSRVGANASMLINFFSNNDILEDQYVDVTGFDVFTYSNYYTDIATGNSGNTFGKILPLPNLDTNYTGGGQVAPANFFNVLYDADFSTLPVGDFTHSQFVTMGNDGAYNNGMGFYNNYGDYYNRVSVVNGTLPTDPSRFARVWLEHGKHSNEVGCDMEFEWFPSPNSLRVTDDNKAAADWTAKEKYFEIYQNFKIRFYSTSPTGFDYEDGHMGGGVIGGYVNVGEPVGTDPNEGCGVDFNFGGIEWPVGGSPNEGTLSNYSTAMQNIIQAKTTAGKKAGIWHIGIYDYNRAANYARQVSVTDENGHFILIEDNRWYDVTLRISMNTIGQENGVLELYIDGRMIYQDAAVKYRIDSRIGVNASQLINFFSNNNIEEDQYVDMTGFKVYTYTSNYTNIATGNNGNTPGKILPLPDLATNWE